MLRKLDKFLGTPHAPKLGALCVRISVPCTVIFYPLLFASAGAAKMGVKFPHAMDALFMVVIGGFVLGVTLTVIQYMLKCLYLPLAGVIVVFGFYQLFSHETSGPILASPIHVGEFLLLLIVGVILLARAGDWTNKSQAPPEGYNLTDVDDHK